MKLAQLIPIENCVINGYSLIENVFGKSVVVYGAMGVMLTTARNAKLFAHAQTLLEDLPLYDANGLSHALAQLREEADRLSQADYDRCVWRERQFAHIEESDYSTLAGCLE